MTFIPAHLLVGSIDAPNLAFVLHGILGSAQNLQGFVRKLHAARSDWGFVLSDVRGHAGSMNAPEPHSLQACAGDLEQLAAQLGRRPRALIGHSFGGKVCLQYAQHSAEGLEQLWLLDTSPGLVQLDENSEVGKVMAAAVSVAQPITQRSEVARAMRERGLPDKIASWMTTNLRRVGEHYEWAVNFDIARTLLADYAASDFWPFLEAEKTSGLESHWIVGEHSDRISPAQRERGAALPVSAKVHVHVLPGAGHWVHVDNPQGLVDLMGLHLPR
ncbi:MAG TPA: alpha/beta hydrolase [Polyangiaceae bacterium]|nr:alpha/beta hydrolase [Polyangiaceae bacterium]